MRRRERVSGATGSAEPPRVPAALSVADGVLRLLSEQATATLTFVSLSLLRWFFLVFACHGCWPSRGVRGTGKGAPRDGVRFRDGRQPSSRQRRKASSGDGVRARVTVPGAAGHTTEAWNDARLLDKADGIAETDRAHQLFYIAKFQSSAPFCIIHSLLSLSV
jgi:hypothetical protein